MSGARRAALLPCLLALALPSSAGAARVPSGLLAGSQDGWISLAFVSAPGMQVSFTETTGGVADPIRTVISDARGVAPVAKARPWRCDRLERTFSAHGVAADGEVYDARYELKTPSCATRLALTVPKHVDRGRSFGVRMVDRFGLGDTDVDLCLKGGGLKDRCYSVLLPAGDNGTVRRFTARRSGQIRVSVRMYQTRVVRRIGVGRARPVTQPDPPVVLVTGDSTVQGVDSFLADRLAGGKARVLSDFRLGSGIVTSGDWRQFSAGQMKSFHPQVTVMSIGGNEGAPFGDAACCGDVWVRRLSTELRALMTTYTRDGGHVAWLTLPVPAQDEHRIAVTTAVNRAIAAAATGQPDVLVVDIANALGANPRTRQVDGVHLSIAGSRLAADTVLKAVETTGWLRGK